MASDGVNPKNGASTSPIFSDTAWVGTGQPRPDNRIRPAPSSGYATPVREISMYFVARNGSIENCVRIRTCDYGADYAHSACHLHRGIEFNVLSRFADRRP
jgi:hypothetical protein